MRSTSHASQTRAAGMAHARSCTSGLRLTAVDKIARPGLWCFAVLDASSLKSHANLVMFY